MVDNQDYARAHAYLKESLALYREVGHVAGIAENLASLGRLEMRFGQYAAAQAWLTEALELQRSLGLPDEGVVHSILGEVALRQDDYEHARAYFEESISLFRNRHPDIAGPDWPLFFLGQIALEQGDEAQAHTLFVESLERFKQAGSKRGIAFALEGLASLSVVTGRPERAVRLFASADHVRTSTGDYRTPVEQADVDHSFAVIRAQLDEVAIAAAWAVGQALTIEQATAEGRAISIS
jgi:tetratricopeptide (TPR) repeat protein